MSTEFTISKASGLPLRQGRRPERWPFQSSRGLWVSPGCRPENHGRAQIEGHLCGGVRRTGPNSGDSDHRQNRSTATRSDRDPAVTTAVLAYIAAVECAKLCSSSRTARRPGRRSRSRVTVKDAMGISARVAACRSQAFLCHAARTEPVVTRLVRLHAAPGERMTLSIGQSVQAGDCSRR